MLRGKVKRDDAEGRGRRSSCRSSPSRGGELWGITGVEPRTPCWSGAVPGAAAPGAIVANVDRVFVVTAVARSRTGSVVIDRLLVLAEANDVPPALVVNKIDLDPGTDLVARYRACGLRGAARQREAGDGPRGDRGVAAGARIGRDRPERGREVEPAQRARARASRCAPAT